MSVNIYVRRNGDLGAACDGCQDTGHHIFDEGGDVFTVMSCDDPDKVIAFMVERRDAARAIEADWNAANQR